MANRVVALLLVAGLAACGGGGGGSGSGAAPPASGGNPPTTPPAATTPPPGTSPPPASSPPAASTPPPATTSPSTTPPPSPPVGVTSPAPSSYGFARVRFIDQSLARDCSGQYSPNARVCSGGGDTAYKTFAAAQNVAAPGTQFIVRGGEYREVLRLRVSGTASAYIGYTEEAGENVVIRGVDSRDGGEDYGPIWLDHVRYNVVRGFTVRDSVGFLRSVDSHFNVIDDGLFDGSLLYPGASKRGGLYFAWSTHNKVLNSTINRGTDSLSLIRSDYNVIHGNKFNDAGHDVWNIKCGSYNVIRANVVTNPTQKLGSVFDCEAPTTNWMGNAEFAENRAIVDSTKRNLIEGNVLHDSVDYYSTSGGNGIQYAGQQGIIRRNVFYGNNVGLGMTQYADEALFNYGNRVYHNVFHDNACSGIAVSGSSGSGRVENNVYKNNALWDNKGWQPDGNCAGVSAAQVLYRTSFVGHLFQANLIASPLGSNVVREEFGAEGGVSAFSDGGNFNRTIETNPVFSSASGHDYTAASGSPLVNVGDYLTSARTAGSGRTLEVVDASWFYDGFGINGERGDLIQLAGQTVTARIVGVDYANNRLTVDRDLSWSANQGVSQTYAGTGPDVGAFER